MYMYATYTLLLLIFVINLFIKKINKNDIKQKELKRKGIDQQTLTQN